MDPVILSRLRQALRAGDAKAAYARSGALALALFVFAVVQFQVFPRQEAVEPLGILLELLVIVAAVSGVVVFDFLRSTPSVYRPMLIGLSFVGVSGTADLLDDLLDVPIWFEVVFESVPFVLGVTGFLFAINNWSKRQSERERELERQNERLDAFASIVSHDLRNPLQVAGASSEAAREEPDPVHFDRLDRALNRMETIVDDVLEFARIGEESTAPSELQFSSVASNAWKTLETDDAEMAIENDGTVYADSGLLLQALENLFRNALDHGGTAVTVRTGVEGTWIYVADNGPGIPSADRERIMTSGYSTATDGTGFGLAIVQSIADAHGWTVRVSESESGGARFELGPVREDADSG